MKDNSNGNIFSAIGSFFNRDSEKVISPLPETPFADANPNVPYGKSIDFYSKKYNLPVKKLAAALSRESADFDPKYVSGYHTDGTGRGIAGIDKVYHSEIADKDAFDPDFAIEWMAKELKSIMARNGNNIDNALREYNGGPNYNSKNIGYGGNTVDQNTQAHLRAINEKIKEFKDPKKA